MALYQQSSDQYGGIVAITLSKKEIDRLLKDGKISWSADAYALRVEVYLE